MRFSRSYTRFPRAHRSSPSSLFSRTSSLPSEPWLRGSTGTSCSPPLGSPPSARPPPLPTLSLRVSSWMWRLSQLPPSTPYTSTSSHRRSSCRQSRPRRRPTGWALFRVSGILYLQFRMRPRSVLLATRYSRLTGGCGTWLLAPPVRVGPMLRLRVQSCQLTWGPSIHVVGDRGPLHWIYCVLSQFLWSIIVIRLVWWYYTYLPVHTSSRLSPPSPRA